LYGSLVAANQPTRSGIQGSRPHSAYPQTL